MQAKIVNLNKAEKFLLNKSIPSQDPNDLGNIGRYCENLLSNLGYKIESRSIVDIPGLGVEIKTRNKHSTSAHTVGKMELERIIDTSWEESPVRQKMLCQFRIEYDNNLNIITEAKVYNFQIYEIQYNLKVSYEAAREIMASGQVFGNYVRGKDFGDNTYAYFENTTKDNYWDFRIPNEKMEQFKLMAKNFKHNSSLFEESTYA